MVVRALALIGVLTVALLALLSVAGLLVLRGARSIQRDEWLRIAPGDWKAFRRLGYPKDADGRYRTPWPAVERDPEFAAAMARVAKDPQWKPFRHRWRDDMAVPWGDA